jgi:hypothetical protein
MGARKGYFIKWNEHDNDTIYVSKARAEQHLGPNPRQGMWVKCTIIDLGPAWAPWDRQHPFTQAIVAEDSPRSRQPSQRPMRPAPLSRENSNSMLLTSTSRTRLESTRSAGCTPSPRTAAQTAKSWKLIQQALSTGKIPEGNWDLVKDAILNQSIAPALQNKAKMPRNRRSSAFACRQHRRSDMGGAAKSWRRASAQASPVSSSSNSPKSQGSNASRGRGGGVPMGRSKSFRMGRPNAARQNSNSRFGSLRRVDNKPLI